MSNGNRRFLSSFEIKISRMHVSFSRTRVELHIGSPERVPAFRKSRCCGLAARVYRRWDTKLTTRPTDGRTNVMAGNRSAANAPFHADRIGWSKCIMHEAAGAC
jgi:hypothetical protein